MHFLLDTHYLIWSIYDDKRLPAELVSIIENEDSRVGYSIISLWETEIKHIKHPDKFRFDAETLYKDAQLAGFRMLDLNPFHINNLSRVNEPDLKHNDPFDRMLIAQAKFENMQLITHDKRLPEYNEECVCYL